MVWGEEEDGRRTASNILISGAKLNTSRRASGSVRQCLIRRALCNAKRSLFSQWLMNCLITRTVPPPTNQHRLPPPNPPTNYHHCTPLQPQSSDVTHTHIHTIPYSSSFSVWFFSHSRQQSALIHYALRLATCIVGTSSTRLGMENDEILPLILYLALSQTVYPVLSAL